MALLLCGWGGITFGQVIGHWYFVYQKKAFVKGEHKNLNSYSRLPKLIQFYFQWITWIIMFFIPDLGMNGRSVKEHNCIRKWCANFDKMPRQILTPRKMKTEKREDCVLVVVINTNNGMNMHYSGTQFARCHHLHITKGRS